MRNSFFLWILLHLIHNESKGLSSVSVYSDRMAVESGGSANLECHYYLNRDIGESVYSVLWYWNPDAGFFNETLSAFSQERYRYFAGIDSSGGDFRYPPVFHRDEKIPFFRVRKKENGEDEFSVWMDRIGRRFVVDVTGSTVSTLSLQDISLYAQGTFTCEVSAVPAFHTASGSRLLRVADLPETLPRVEGYSLRHPSRGQPLDLKCTISGGIPFPNITWYINGDSTTFFLSETAERESISIQPAAPEYLSKNSSREDDSDREEVVLFTKISTLHLPNLKTFEMMSSMTLKVKCAVSMYDLYHRSNEISIEVVPWKKPPTWRPPPTSPVIQQKVIEDEEEAEPNKDESKNQPPEIDQENRGQHLNSDFIFMFVILVNQILVLSIII